jgi:hypothetical protein
VFHETRARVLLWILGAVAALALPATASASDCLSLDCGTPASPGYVPEAHGGAPVVAGLDELKAQTESGFYEVPAQVSGGVVYPRSVVYLSKPGQFERMPASVRNLPQVTHFAVTRGSELSTATLVVIHPGILLIITSDTRAATRRGSRAKAAQLPGDAWNDCPDRNFCLWSQDDWEEAQFNIHGPMWVGTGWHNFPSTYNDVANSQVNRRDGDSLLALGTYGAGPRYCAQQQSLDSTFSNNFGNNVATSWALLGSGTNRC